MSVEVKNFRETNRLLHRLPHYTEHRWELWAWLAVLILAEFILNFLLLREAGTALTVIVQSLLYGLINVIFPFVFFSRWIRYKNHVNWRRALIGWCSVVLFLVYVIAVNLLMAHYRGVVLETAGDIATAQGFDVELLQRYWDSQRLAVERFATDPFGLTDIWSWFLFIGGCGLALAGLYKGYTSDDRYPGYGSLKRRYEEKYRRYVQGVEETCHTLKLRREDAVEEIGALSSRLEEEHRNLPQIVQSAVALRGRCRLALQRLDTDFQMLIREYRNINQTNRDTPPPDYFEDEATLGEVPLEEFQPGEIPSPNEAIDRLQGFSDELHEQFEQLVGKIESTRQVLDDNYPFMVQPVVGGA